MARPFTITLRNLSPATMSFYCFQQRATFDPTPSSGVSSASLGGVSLGSYAATGTQSVFTLDPQPYAGAASTMNSTARVAVSSISYAAQPIALAVSASDTVSADSTILSIVPLGLSPPVNRAGLKTGSFAIQVPVYQPCGVPSLWCGCAAYGSSNARITLASAIIPPPNQTILCAPLNIFFIRTGSYAFGTPIPYDTTPTSSATCDFTSGATAFLVQYEPDGTFSTSPMSP